MVTAFTAESEETVLQSTTLQVIDELLLHSLGKEPVLGS